MQQNNFPQNYSPQFTPGQSPARPSPAPNPMAGQMMPQQMGQMSQQHMQQMQQMQQQMMSGQMAAQMSGQVPGQMASQMPNMMYSQQQMGQPRNVLEQQKLLYQMQLQQQAQRTSLQMQQMGAQNMMQGQHHQNQAQAQARNMMAARQGVPNGQMPPGAMRQQPGAPPQQIPRVAPPEQFMKHLTALMNSKNLPLDAHPVVEGRQIPLYNLFQFVFNKAGGYRNTTQSNVWPQVSQFMGFPPQQFPAAPQYFRAIYERNLLKYEEFYVAQQKMRQQQHQQQQQQHLLQQQQQGGMSNVPNMNQGTPTKLMAPGQIPPQMKQPGQQPQLQQAQIQLSLIHI